MRHVLVFILSLALLAGCGSAAGSAVSGGGSSASATPPPALASPQATPLPTVTLAPDENGQTIDLSVGQRLLLKLGTDRDWEVTVTDPSILSAVPGVLVVRGAQGLYEARQPGATTIEANGKGICGTPGQVCSMVIIHLEFHVVVGAG